MKRALFIGAHCDDCEWMGGGTAIALRQAGVEVSFLHVLGAVGESETRERTHAAARASAKILDVNVEIGDISNRKVSLRKEAITELIRRKVADVRPGILFIGPPFDYMVDHMVVAECAYHVAVTIGQHEKQLKPMEVLALECPSAPFPYVDFYINTSDTSETAEKALLCYCMKEESFGRGLAKTRRGLSLIRGEQADRVRFAEGFRTISKGGKDYLIRKWLPDRFLPHRGLTAYRTVYPL